LDGCASAAGPESAGEAAVAAAPVEKPKTDPWKVEAQPIREDQVVNAVNFLSHSKVRGSPIVHRRTFLERKGLTGEEIDEAFRRVPVLYFSYYTGSYVLYENTIFQLVFWKSVVIKYDFNFNFDNYVIWHKVPAPITVKIRVLDMLSINRHPTYWTLLAREK